MSVAQLITDLKALPPRDRVLINANFDRGADKVTREHLVKVSDLLAAIRSVPSDQLVVRVMASPSLNVRQSAPNGAVVARLAKDAVVVVYAVQKTIGWYQLSDGQYIGNYISAEYVEEVQ